MTPTLKFLGTAEAYFVCRIGPNFQISLRPSWVYLVCDLHIRVWCKLDLSEMQRSITSSSLFVIKIFTKLVQKNHKPHCNIFFVLPLLVRIGENLGRTDSCLACLTIDYAKIGPMWQTKYASAVPKILQ